MKAFRAARWVALNGALAYVAWAGVVGGVEWAGNLLRFYLWAAAVLLLIAFLVISADGDADEITRSVPGWVDSTFDLLLIVLLAAHGWFLYASLAVVGAVCGAGIFHAQEMRKATP